MRRVPLLIVLLLTFTWASADAQSEPPKRRGGSVVSDEYIVLLKDGSRDPAEVAREHAKRHGASVRHVYRSAVRGYSARVPKSRLDALRRDPDVAGVTPNVTVRASLQTTGTGVSRVGPNPSGLKGTSVNVAVIDGGVDVNHPDLQANIAGGASCIPGDPSYDDKTSSGHGTHVAGIIGALNNTTGSLGVAPEADIWAIRVFGTMDQTTLEVILCGVDWADKLSIGRGGPVTLANMSIEAFVPGLEDDDDCGFTEFDPLHQAICALVAHGVTVVVAAGNSGEEIAGPVFNDDIIPAAYDEVITASALADSDGDPCGDGPSTGVGADDTFATFSNYAPVAEDQEHMLAGPGVNILSTLNNGSTGTMSGTSQAAPHITGVAALFQETMPGATPAEVKAALLAVAEPKGVDFNGECGGLSFSHTDPMPGANNPEPLVRIDGWEIPPEASTAGLVRGNVWHLNNNYDIFADTSFSFASLTDKPVVGDWDGDGDDEPGMVRGNVWHLTDEAAPTAIEKIFPFASSTDKPIVGNWDNDPADEPGVIRGNVWYLADAAPPTSLTVFSFASSTDRPVVGDWDNDGDDEPGMVRGNVWNLTDAVPPSAIEHTFAFASASDLPVSGDWDADGDDNPGVVRGNRWFLNTGFGDGSMLIFRYGISSDRKIVGDWDGENP